MIWFSKFNAIFGCLLNYSDLVGQPKKRKLSQHLKKGKCCWIGSVHVQMRSGFQFNANLELTYIKCTSDNVRTRTARSLSYIRFFKMIVASTVNSLCSSYFSYFFWTCLWYQKMFLHVEPIKPWWDYLKKLLCYFDVIGKSCQHDVRDIKSRHLSRLFYCRLAYGYLTSYC